MGLNSLSIYMLRFLILCLYFLAGYAFVYFEDERDAEDAIRGIDNTTFGYERRKLSVEWAKVSHSSFSHQSYTDFFREL